MNEKIGSKGFFDRICEEVANETARAWFFAICVGLVAAWFVEGAIRITTSGWQAFMDNAYQLQINTTTTIVTFLLVALLQNSQRRDVIALQHKLDVLATGLRDLMDHVAHVQPCDVQGCDFCEDIGDLEVAIGIEDKVGTNKAEDARRID